MKKSSRDTLNLLFSSFLIVGYIVCSYFFLSLTTRVSQTVATVIQIVVYVLFGLLVFYATRVGEGKPVKRFSPVVLVVLDLPALLMIIASIAPNFPLYDQLASQPIIMVFAGIALGYGLPYTFLSGFEMIEDPDDSDDNVVMVEGGIAQELEQAQSGDTDDEQSSEQTETQQDTDDEQSTEQAETQQDTYDEQSTEQAETQQDTDEQSDQPTQEDESAQQ